MPKATLIAGLLYGDEGKGTTTDFFAYETNAKYVVRYNGGPQTAHNVITVDGRHHTFTQFGSATLRGVRTYLSKYMLVNPLSLINEANHLRELGVENPEQLISIDKDALLVLPYHKAANQLREILRENPHGSVGLGIGESRRIQIEVPDLAPTVGDLRNEKIAIGKFQDLMEFYKDEFKDIISSDEKSWSIGNALQLLFTPPNVLYDRMHLDFIMSRIPIVDSEYINKVFKTGNVIFEGAQGILLDETYGFAPHTTWTNITFDNANELIQLADIDEVIDITKVGVVRTYMTRHGHGPFITESRDPILLSKEKHNKDGYWQGSWRVGYFDMVAFKYAIDVIGNIDMLSITHLDTINDKKIKICTAYEINGERVENLKKLDNPTWEQQMKFTEEFRMATPIIEELDKDEFIEELIGYGDLGEGVLSSGPTISSKELIKL